MGKGLIFKMLIIILLVLILCAVISPRGTGGFLKNVFLLIAFLIGFVWVAYMVTG